MSFKISWNKKEVRFQNKCFHRYLWYNAFSTEQHLLQKISSVFPRQAERGILSHHMIWSDRAPSAVADHDFVLENFEQNGSMLPLVEPISSHIAVNSTDAFWHILTKAPFKYLGTTHLFRHSCICFYFMVQCCSSSWWKMSMSTMS